MNRLCGRCHEFPADPGYEVCDGCHYQIQLAAAEEILTRETRDDMRELVRILVTGMTRVL